MPRFPTLRSRPLLRQHSWSALLRRRFEVAFEANTENILALLREGLRGVAAPAICDLGGGDGQRTARFAQACPGARVTIVETYPPLVAAARARGFSVLELNIERPLELPSDAFDAVLSNQVIEHLYDTDTFLAEALRILRPGGILIVSTENAASWHNVGALFLGWQPFSLGSATDRVSGLGNPLSAWAGTEGNRVLALQHHRIFALRGLRHLIAAHGFVDIRATGAGYYPLPAAVGRLDPRHAHFITVRGRKLQD